MEENIRKAEEKGREKEKKKAEKEQREKEKATLKMKSKNACSGSSTKRTLRSRSGKEDQPTRLDDFIQLNKCCVCYDDYEEDEDVEWVQCSCSRWLHEECIIDARVDTSGKELLCPHCA